MRRQHASMELRGLAPAGVVAAATDAAGAAAAAAQLFDTSGADSSDPEAAMGSGGSSANRKKSRKRRRGPPTGPTFRRFTRQLAIAAAASMAFALLLVFAARWMNALGGSGSTAAMAAATAAGSSAAALLQAAAADPGSTLVEFGAPGVMLPCRDAFDLSLPERAEEAALLELLPPGIPAGGRAAADAAVAQPTLAQVLDLFGQDGSGGAAVKANELQSALQQQEAEMQRAKDAAREAALGRDRPGEWEQLPGAAASRPRGLLLDSGSSAVQQALGGSGPAHAEGTAASAVRLLVGVVSACCSETAAVRRAAVRETWGRAVQEHPGAELRFFLAQPPSAAVAAALLPAIAGEVAAHGDIVVLRGADTYKNLPNKTLRLLRFAVAAPAAYTHVLKTDDDCFLRLPQVLDALSDPLDSDGTPIVNRSPALPATRQQLLEMAGRGGGAPLHTDGINLWNMSRFAEAAASSTTVARRLFDNEEGRAESLAGIVRASAEAARRAAAGRAGSGSGRGGRSGAPIAAQAAPEPRLPRMTGVYLGCLENEAGFFPIRSPSSKWFVSYADLPDSAVPFATKYLAGWGVVLSRDVAQHALGRANGFLRRPDTAPAWFGPQLPWEDVQLGLLTSDVVAPQHHPAFRAAWRACSPATALKHLDVDAPRLFWGLHAQDASGLWDQKPVQCSSGDFLPGDYAGWKQWRDGLPTVEHI